MKRRLVVAVAFLMAIYHLASTQYLFQSPIEHQNTHFSFALLLVFLVSLKKKSLWPVTLVFLALSLAATAYVKLNFPALERRAGVFTTTADIMVGLALIVVALEATRRAFGWVLPIVGGIFIAYTFFGQYLPPPFWHFPQTLKQIVTIYNIGLYGSGMYGTALSVSTQYIFLFMLFGGLLTVSGGSRFVLELAKAPARKFAGGAGLTAIFASSLMGLVTGAAAANIAIVGPFTIPLMKRAGYKPEQAGAIEAAASTGAAIVPPVMGAVAFIMAGYLDVSYWQVCLMAIIPSVLYYYCLALYAQFNAMRTGVQAVAGEKVDTRAMWSYAPPLLAPLAVLTVVLAQGYSANFAAFWAIISVLVVSMVRKETRATPGAWLDGMTKGAVGGAQIGVTTAFLGVITASIDLSGLGVKFPALVDTLSGGNPWMGLLLIALITTILGCGVPPVAAYMVVASLAVPAVVRMGVDLYAAHFFVFFYAVFALITPPVAIAPLVASALAGAGFWKTSVESVKAATVAFFLPFLVILAPVIILQPQPPVQAVTSLLASFVLVGVLQALVTGHYLSRLMRAERLVLLAAAVLLIVYLFTQDYALLAAGLVLAVGLTIWQVRRRRLLPGKKPEYLSPPPAQSSTA